MYTHDLVTGFSIANSNDRYHFEFSMIIATSGRPGAAGAQLAIVYVNFMPAERARAEYPCTAGPPHLTVGQAGPRPEAPSLRLRLACACA